MLERIGGVHLLELGSCVQAFEGFCVVNGFSLFYVTSEEKTRIGQ